jgi:hypothetical protein
MRQIQNLDDVNIARRFFKDYTSNNIHIFKIKRKRVLPRKQLPAYLTFYVPYARITLLAGA